MTKDQKLPCGGFVKVSIPPPPSKHRAQRAGPVQIGKVSYVIAPGKKKRLGIRLSAKGKKILKRRGRLTVTISNVSNNGDTTSVKRKLVYHPPRRKKH